MLSRFSNVEKEKLFITFDNDLSKDYPDMVVVNSENFPKDLLEITSKSVKKYALRGFIYKQSKPLRFNFENIVEISNFLGIDIYEEHDGKFKLVHKSTSINKPLKNLEDIILLILFGIPIACLIFIVSIIILIFQGRPIFYKQIRVGENGKYFHIYKFRSMIDKKLTEEQIKQLNERSKIVFKSSNDPRITKLGKFLRKSSIDELPQIINIFKNEMSFIGPRPPITEEVEQYELRHLKRISIKPGITGLWQVTLRQDNDFEKWVKKDIEYIDNWSLVKDIKILFLTILEIIKLSGE
jgi:lipopolysaccharide/colanic/teichoic acid biosynthesis glycosyltransferase